VKTLLKLAPKQLLVNYIFYAFLIATALHTLLDAHASKYRADTKVYYVAGTLVRTGNISKIYNFDYQTKLHAELIGNKIKPLYFITLPAVATLFAPFTFLDFYHYYLALIVLNTVAVGLLFYLFRNKYNISNVALAELSIFIPMASAIFQSQIAVLLLLNYVAAIMKIRKPCVTALFAGTLLFKPQYLLFVPMLFLFIQLPREKIRFLSGFNIFKLAF